MVRAHCSGCGGPRSSFVRASHAMRRSAGDGAVDWCDAYRVLECCGCGELIVQNEHSLSEGIAEERDPETGEWHEASVVICPSRCFRLQSSSRNPGTFPQK